MAEGGQLLPREPRPPRSPDKAGMLLPPVEKRWTDEQVYEVMFKYYGVRTLVCMALDCSQRQLDRWMRDRPEAKKALSEARAGLVSLAEEVVLDALRSPAENIRLDAAKQVLKGLGGSCGWAGPQAAVQVEVPSGGDQKAVVRAIFGMPGE